MIYLTPDPANSKNKLNEERSAIQKNIFSIITKFLIYIDLVKEESQSRISIDTHAFIYELMHLGAAANKKGKLGDLKLDFDQIMFLVILLRASRTVPKIGFPAPLLDEARRYYSGYLFERVRNDPSWSRPPSRRRFEAHVVSLAERLWMFGSTFSPEQIARMIDTNALIGLTPTRDKTN